MAILNASSTAKLAGVDPRLVAVVKRAFVILGLQSAIVVEGLRTREKALENYRKGRTAAELKKAGVQGKPLPGPKVTWTLNSKHCDGKAVDVAPLLPDGSVDWAAHGDYTRYNLIYHAMMQAASELKVHLRYGGDWDMDGKLREKGETDSPHYELA